MKIILIMIAIIAVLHALFLFNVYIGCAAATILTVYALVDSFS